MFRKPDGVGKGNQPRPMFISKEEYAKRWDKIFGKRKGKDKMKTEISGMGGPQTQKFKRKR